MEGSSSLPAQNLDPDQRDAPAVDAQTPDVSPVSPEGSDLDQRSFPGGLAVAGALEDNNEVHAAASRRHTHHKKPKETPVERLYRLGEADLIDGMGV